MRKYIIILFCIILSSNLIYAHEQSAKAVHQRIIIEAYKLLKLQLSKEATGFADMDQWIGDAIIYNQYWWHHVNSVANGSEHEDREDIVYGYKGVRSYLLWGEWSHTSITHFWDADKPYGDDGGKVKLYDGGHFPSAYTKAQAYIFDEYTKEIKTTISHDCFLGTAKERKHFCKDDPNKHLYLYNWYWKDRIYVNFSHDICWGIPRNRMHNYYWDVGNEFCRRTFFNILGRLCHLLTDMGVPEHAKRSMHPSIGVVYPAPFEYWLKDNYDTDFYWTAEKVYKERGGFINPFCEVNGDRNLFLFYTLGQLSDWFAAWGCMPSNGDDNYDPNIGEIQSIINSYAPDAPLPYIRTNPHTGEGGGLLNCGTYVGIDDGKIYREVLLPYTIRAVAGMLYKYIIETKMQFPNATTEDMGMVYDQQQELNLFNQEINGNYYTFRAEGNPGRITVCPENRPAGYPADFLIDSEARNVTFRAANEVIFKPGFSAIEGSQVRAYIIPGCSRTNQSGNCQECLEEDFNPQYDKSAQ